MCQLSDNSPERVRGKGGAGGTNGDDGLHVEGSDRSKVDDLSLDTVRLEEGLGNLEAVSNHLRVSDEGDVRALSFDLSLADGEEELIGSRGDT
jgi:hypothetical protein